MPHAVALLSGGLDSALSIRILQHQGFEVHALNVRTIYSCGQATAAKAAAELGAPLTVVSVGDDYLDLIRNPLYGYGKGVNPCIDCRIYMCRLAGRLMDEVNACAVITGEIVGQRPMSQKRHQLEIIARRSGLNGRLLRPLSAKLLPPTIPELEGLVDRQKLYDFNGRGRRRLIKLAEKFGIPQMPSPSSGCALTEPLFAPRVRDLMQFHPEATRWDFELLNHGRHFRLDEHTRIVISRSAKDSATLRSFGRREDASDAALLVPEDFRGPDALVVGRVTEPAVQLAGALVLRYARRDNCRNAHVRVTQLGSQRLIQIRSDEAADRPRSCGHLCP